MLKTCLKTNNCFLGSEPEVKFVKTTFSHPKDQLERKAKTLPDGNSDALLIDFPFDPKEFLEKP